MEHEPFSAQLGPIRVGLSGLTLVAAGAVFWFGIEPTDLPAQVARYIGLVGGSLGVASVATWACVAGWRKLASK